MTRLAPSSLRYPTVILGVMMCFLLAISPAAHAQLYYGTTTNNDLASTPDNEFGTIVNNQLVPIGITGEPQTFTPVDDQEGRFRGLAYNTNDGLMYAAIRGWNRGGDPDMVTIDTATGQVRDYVHRNVGPLTTGLTYDAATNQLITAISRGSKIGFNNPLPAGFVSTGSPVDLGDSKTHADGTVGETTEAAEELGGRFDALAVNPADGRLWSIGESPVFSQETVLIEIDKTTGAPISTTPVTGGILEVEAMTFRRGRIVAAANSADSPQVAGAAMHGGKELWEIDLNGNATMLNADLGAHVDALEYVIPEPSSLVLLAMGLTCLGGFRRKRRA